MNRRLLVFSAFRILILLSRVFRLAMKAQSNPSQPIHNIVLVRGAWADGSSWHKIVPILEKKRFACCVRAKPSDLVRRRRRCYKTDHRCPGRSSSIGRSFPALLDLKP
jgi:hypothetical protein